MSIIQGNAHTSAGGGYQIERSLRFNSADSAYLSRTLSSSGNMKVFTLSFWLKRTALGVINNLFTVRNGIGSGTEYFQIKYNSNDTISVIGRDSGSVTRCNVSSTAVFRDPGAWAHIVISFNASSTTLNVYANNVVIANSTSIGNVDYGWNNSALAYHRIGDGALLGEANLNGYMTELYHVDGQALTPSSFGETDSATGVWKPKAYSGTYGTNGFYLKFADNSGTTSTTLGKDSSSNSNNWTPNNFSVTAGAGNDSLVDSPTAYGTDTGVGGEVRGNYCTLNPLDEPSTYAAAGTPVNGNLDFSVSNDTAAGATFAVSSGKWYWEMTVVSGHSAGANTIWTAITSINPSSSNKLAWQAGSGSRSYATTGLKFNENTSSSYGNTYTNGDVIGCALDLDNGKVYWSKNGTFQASGDPVAGTNAAFTGLTGTWLPEATQNAGVTAWNFGQRAFAYTAPSGFKALVTTNLPTPTIGATSTTQAGKYFNPVLYTGNGSNRSITGVGFQPDFVWIKKRSGAESHVLSDAIRGTNNFLSSNSTASENTASGTLTAFNSDGFSLGTQGIVNDNTFTFVSWNWNAGGSTVTNTSGTISAQVRANTTSGFSIVTYTGTGGSGTTTVGHGLGVAPVMVIIKRRSTTGDWSVYHQSLTSTSYYIGLNTTAAQQTYGSTFISPGSSTLTIAADSSLLNVNASTYVAYCFAAVAGYSAFGSYVGNAAADGPFIYTGFRPEFVMIKASSSTGDWVMQDVARSPYNVSTNYLVANASTAEQTGQLLDFVSNGFKIRVAVSGAMNGSGTTYIYTAFAENPFKYALAR